VKIFIRVKPGAAKDSIEQLDATHYLIATTQPPVKGRANAAVIEMLSKHLKIAKTNIVIKRGANSKQKTLEVVTNQNLFT